MPYFEVTNKFTGKTYLWRVTYAEAQVYVRNYRGADWHELVIR